MKESLICKYSINVTAIKSKDTIKKLISENSCAKSYMESVPRMSFLLLYVYSKKILNNLFLLDYGRCVPKRVFDLIATVKAAVDQVEQDNGTISIKLLKYIKQIDSLKEVIPL